MKFVNYLFFLFFSFFVTACSTSQFKQSDLDPTLYRGYWSMNPVDGLHLVLKFNPNGSVRVYDYSCEGRYSHRLAETTVYYLRKIGRQRFELLDKAQTKFAIFEILQVTSSQLQAKQTFTDPNVQPHFYQLRYQYRPTIKPICS